MTVKVNEQTIRRGLVTLTIPSYDNRSEPLWGDAWESYRFRCINIEYPTPSVPPRQESTHAA